MGLDVTAYKGLYLPNPALAENEDGFVLGPDGEPLSFAEYLQISVDPAFPNHVADLQPDVIYLCAGSEPFWSSSYIKYSAWREKLAELAGYPAVPFQLYPGMPENPSHAASAYTASGGPFYELINFTDCDGTIGTAFCQKLLKDFIEFEPKTANMSEAFKYNYQVWKSTFEYASDNGAVDFG